MRKKYPRTMRHWMTALLMLVTAAFAHAVESGQHATVQGIEIYYGILPAQVAGKHPLPHEERAMHGGASTGKNAYHLVVALFGTAGKRLTEAEVRATVADLGLAGTRKQLEPMRIDEAMSYGGYFILPGDGPYRIALEIRLPGTAKPIEALFEYRRR